MFLVSYVFKRVRGRSLYKIIVLVASMTWGNQWYGILKHCPTFKELLASIIKWNQGLSSFLTVTLVVIVKDPNILNVSGPYNAEGKDRYLSLSYLFPLPPVHEDIKFIK